MMFALAAVLAAVLAQPADVPVKVIDRGAQSGIEEPRQVVLTNQEQFATMWRRHTARPQPTIDFSRESVVAIFLGTRSTAGYAVDVVSVARESAGTVVTYREASPRPGGITAQVLTFPFVIVSLPTVTLPVRFEAAR